MRVRRWLVVATVIGTTLALPLEAGADGGAFIDLRGGSASGRWGSHFLPGDPASGTAYVSVPKNAQDVLDRGPFYTYLVPGNGWIQEGRALPQGTIRLGPVTIEPDPTSNTIFAIRTSFVVPDLPGDLYTIQICNEPCTVAGFREALSGQISIVQTTREADLLNTQQRLFGENYSLQHRARKAEKANEELAISYELSRSSVLELSAEVSRLERELEAAQTEGGVTAAAPAADTDGRPLADAWVLFALGIALIVALASIGLAMVFARRRAPSVVIPDTIAELDNAEMAETASR